MKAALLMLFLVVIGSATMKAEVLCDYSAAEQVIEYFAAPDEAKLKRIAEHPAYRLVFEHSQRYSSNPLDKSALIASLRGKSDAFDFSGLDKRLSELKKIIGYLKSNRNKIDEFAALSQPYLPKDHKKPATIYFIIGGYNGIALGDRVAINIDCRQFRNDPQEILLYLPHELFHLGFARYQQLPDPHRIKTVGELRDLVLCVTMNEGLATLVPYAKRKELNALTDYDYSVLTELCVKISQFDDMMKLLQPDDARPVDEQLFGNVMSQCSGDRLFYIIGCHMGLAIEKQHGRGKLVELIKQSPKNFFDAYNALSANQAESGGPVGR